MEALVDILNGMAARRICAGRHDEFADFSAFLALLQILLRDPWR